MIVLLLGSLLSGCVWAPKENKLERAKADEAGKVYQQPWEKRELPELSAQPTWQEVLHRAFLANGELETAYFDWVAALQRVDQAAAYPGSNLQVGFEYMFSGGKMKAWNRTTVTAGFDPAMPLPFPTKVIQAGKVAYEQARAAGLRFENAKFDLQKRVLTAYLDYALMAEKVRIGRDNVALLKMIASLAADRVRTGAPQQDLLKAQIQYRLAQNELANMEQEMQGMRAMLNGMLARSAEAPLAPPAALPEPRLVQADDAALIAMAVDRNPELGALARDVAGRKDALKLAKMAWIPDINPLVGLEGSVAQMAGVMIMLPTAIPVIQGQIKESRAMLRGSEAMVRQVRYDRAASFVAALYAMRNAERQTKLFHDLIGPNTQQVMRSSRDAYAAGQVTFLELVDSQRTLLDVRQVIAEARIEREKRLAEMEALAGVDIETLAQTPTPPTTPPTTVPATAPATAPATQLTASAPTLPASTPGHPITPLPEKSSHE